MSETSKDGDRVEGGKRLFFSQSKAHDRRVHRDSTVFACVVATCMKRRTSSMIIDVKLYKYLTKAFVFA